MNPILLTDSYKLSHYKQYPPKTTRIYSYFESRGGKWPETTFFGLQAILMKYMAGRILYRSHITDAEKLLDLHMGPGLFNKAGWEHILTAHGGYLPLHIRSVAEGASVPVSNVLFTVENTCDQCYWVTNYFETLLSQVWYPTTVATLSREAKKIILRYLERSGTPEQIDYKLHDFGYRGVSSVDSAGLGGLAHLVNFKGTDTLAALDDGRKYYAEPCAGHSIPASEHSTITAWGMEHELAAFKNMLDQYPTGLVACVSDSYNIHQACEQLWGTDLRAQVLSRDGTLVVRPDSGYPPQVSVEVIEVLGQRFGFTHNAKGYKVLDPHVRVIYGDLGPTNLDMIEEVCHQLQFQGWSMDNLAFGMGGGLLQNVNRDTQKFKLACSAATINGEEVEVWKDPIGDPGKRSKRGRLSLVNGPAGIHTIRENGSTGLLVDRFYEGKMMNQQTLTQVREIAALPILVAV